MKIITTADLHLDIERKRTHAFNTIDKILNSTADVLLFVGDMGQTKQGIREGFEKLSAFKGLKLAVLGNNELKSLESSILGTHYDEMKELIAPHGFHLLDIEPVIYEGVGFVGNVGWYDFSLYEGVNYEKYLPHQLEYFYTNYRTGGITPQELTSICCEQVKNHHSKIVDHCDKIVMSVHCAGFKEFLRFDKRLFEMFNMGMGSKKIGELYDLNKIVWGLCGHTHRSGRIEKNGFFIDNVSSDKNQPYLEKEL